MHLWCKIWKSQVTVRNVDLRVFWGRPWGVFLRNWSQSDTILLKMVFDCRNVWKMICTSIHHIFRATKNKGWHRLPPSQTWDVGLFIYWLFLQGYSAYFYSEWLQVLNEKGYKAVENRTQWAAICRILLCGSWGQTNGDGAAERKQAERHVPGGIRGFLITEKRCESRRRVCVIQTWPQQQTSQTGKAEVLFIPTKERFTCAKGHPFILRDFTSPWCCVRFPPARVDFSFLILEL